MVLRWPGLMFLSLPLCRRMAASVSGVSLKPYFTMNLMARTMRVASSVKVLSGLDGHFIEPAARSASPHPVRSMISALSGPFARSCSRHISVLWTTTPFATKAGSTPSPIEMSNTSCCPASSTDVTSTYW